MSDKVSVANTKSDASPNHQNDISAQAIATKILTEVSNGLSGKDATAGTQAQNDLANLMTDPLQHQVLNQIATDMNDSAMMKTLGLTGSVNKDDLGNVTSLSFTSDAGMQAYNNTLVGLEKSGLTPTQAANEVNVENSTFINNAFFTGQTTLNSDGLTPAEEQEKSIPAPGAAAAPADQDQYQAPLGYAGSGIVVN